LLAEMNVIVVNLHALAAVEEVETEAVTVEVVTVAEVEISETEVTVVATVEVETVEETVVATVEVETVVATVEVETVAEEEISETEVVTEVVTEVEVSVNSVNDQVAKIENPALNAKKIPVVVVETIHKKRALIILEIESQITHSSPVIMTIEVSK
jgi:hypothetical protein